MWLGLLALAADPASLQEQDVASSARAGIYAEALSDKLVDESIRFYDLECWQTKCLQEATACVDQSHECAQKFLQGMRSGQGSPIEAFKGYTWKQLSMPELKVIKCGQEKGCSGTDARDGLNADEYLEGGLESGPDESFLETDVPEDAEDTEDTEDTEDDNRWAAPSSEAIPRGQEETAMRLAGDLAANFTGTQFEASSGRPLSYADRHELQRAFMPVKRAWVQDQRRSRAETAKTLRQPLQEPGPIPEDVRMPPPIEDPAETLRFCDGSSARLEEIGARLGKLDPKPTDRASLLELGSLRAELREETARLEEKSALEQAHQRYRQVLRGLARVERRKRTLMTAEG